MQAQVKKTPKMLEIEAKFGKDLEEILREEYVAKMRGIYNIGKKLGVASTTVDRWLHNCGIPVRSICEALLPIGFVEPSEKQLRQWYVGEKMNLADIAKKIGVSYNTVAQRLRKYGISLRSFSEIRLPTGFAKPSKEQLWHWYVDERMFPREIAKKIGVSRRSVYNWLNEEGVPTKINRPSKKELHQLYVIEKLGAGDIGEKTGISRRTVFHLLNYYKIPKRNHSYSCSKDSVKELLKTYVGEKKYATRAS